MSSLVKRIDRFVAVDGKGVRHTVDVFQRFAERDLGNGEALDLPCETFMETVEGDAIDLGGDGSLKLAGESLRRL